MENPSTVSDAEVRKIARLARLQVPDDEAHGYAHQLSSILRYADRLRGLNLGDDAPLPHVGETSNRLDEDVPGAVLDNSVLMAMAPDTREPFIRVPKVFGEDGGA
jgi:aspartyl-tRNA(Asn)/glutamyl-tRNA(Gln) amidotransferase subunit C